MTSDRTGTNVAVVESAGCYEASAGAVVSNTGNTFSLNTTCRKVYIRPDALCKQRYAVCVNE